MPTLKEIFAENAKSYYATGYVAPTIFKVKGVIERNILLYNSLDKAFNKYTFNRGLHKHNPKPSGNLVLESNYEVETIGINVDFYMFFAQNGFVQVPYSIVRTLNYEDRKKLICRLYKKDTSGPHYALFDADKMGVAATPIAKVSKDKLALLDEFNRNLQLIKWEHNTLADFLTSLSKQKLTPAQQQKFNEGQILLANLREQIKTIKGVELSTTTSRKDTIGVIPIIYIVGAVILAAIAAWTITQIVKENNKTKQILSNNNLQQYMADYKLKVAEEVQAGKISVADGKKLQDNADKTIDKAQENNTNLTNDTTKAGFMDRVENIATIALIAYGISKFMK